MIENGIHETCTSTKFYRDEKFLHKPSIYNILYNWETHWKIYDLEKTVKQVSLFRQIRQLTWNEWSVKDEYILINMKQTFNLRCYRWNNVYP